MKEDFKVGDILICKKTIDSDHYFVPRIQMIQGAEYRVCEVLPRYISIAINSTNKDFIDETKHKDYYHHIEEDKQSYSAWDKWFYTKAELREMKFKELGI